MDIALQDADTYDQQGRSLREDYPPHLMEKAEGEIDTVSENVISAQRASEYYKMIKSLG